MMSRYNNNYSVYGMKRYYIYTKLVFYTKFNRDIILAKEKKLGDMISMDDLCFCGSGKRYKDCCNDIYKNQ